MSKVNSKFIKWGTGANQVNADSMPANRTATNYTAGSSTTKGHLDGIDTKIGTLFSTGDIPQTSFSAANNQSSAANVTGLAFANGSVRGFEAIVTVVIDATQDLFENFKIIGIQRAADWKIDISSVGDSSGIALSITNAGQIQYTSGNYAGFVSGTLKFRALTTTV